MNTYFCVIGLLFGVAHAQYYFPYQSYRPWQRQPDYHNGNNEIPKNEMYNRGHQMQYPSQSASQDPAYGQPQPPMMYNPTTCNEHTCKLPSCFCGGFEAPGNMAKNVTPQIVMFTFDDAVNEQVYDYYGVLFPPERVNPNGCPISATFFVSHNWTDYNMVKQLYLRGHEIASHSITHRMPQSWWVHATYDTLLRELSGQRDNIVKKASVPKSEVRGIRVPFVAIGGDNQFKMMQDEGFEYDASFMVGPHSEGGLWPYTLDFPPKLPSQCSNTNCPKSSYKGMWEVALNRWTDPKGQPCAMVDSCTTQPSHKGEALSYLWQNFNKQYYGNRAPVGVNMHAVWFKTDYHYDAMKEFVSTLADMDDVYIVTVHQTLQWMREAKTLDQLKDWEAWKNTCPGHGKKKLVKMVSKKRDPMKPHLKEKEKEKEEVTEKTPTEKVEKKTQSGENINPKIRERSKSSEVPRRNSGERRGRGNNRLMTRGVPGQSDSQSHGGKQSSANAVSSSLLCLSSGIFILLVYQREDFV